MGFTPLAGVEMGTRCGDIDPAIVTYIMDKEGYTPDEMSNFMNKKSGLLGVSGISSDSRDIEAAVKNGDYRATLAANMLGYGIKKYIGSYIAAMNGVDAIVFTAGMGENNSEMRERVCTDMEFFGIKIDLDANAKTYKPQGPMEISTPDSKVKVFVIPTNEELMIARETDRIVSARK
jgi:acetate kinase